MPVVASAAAQAGGLVGLHLYHYGLSNCSQRVRILLAEKSLAWTSHHIDLRRDRHAAPSYLRINPAGLVPALIHDGRLVTESLDILDYIEAAFPLPSLAPPHRADAALSALAADVQPAIKLLSHEFLFRPARRMGAAQLDAFARAHPDQALVGFMRSFSSARGFMPDQIAAAAAEIAEAFGRLDGALQQQAWLAGPAFSTADIAWMPNIRRMELLGYPVGRWPALWRWYGQVRRRPSFKTALLAYEPASVRLFFGAYGLLRRLAASDVRHFLPQPPVPA